MMNDNHSQPTWVSLTQTTAAVPSAPSFVKQGGQFDRTPVLSDMKKLQDPAKFQKARFAFRLYRRP